MTSLAVPLTCAEINHGLSMSRSQLSHPSACSSTRANCSSYKNCTFRGSVSLFILVSAGRFDSNVVPMLDDLLAHTRSHIRNLLAADSAGHIGWSIFGAVPRRVGLDGRFPASWADGRRGWSGWLEPSEYPRVIDPPSGRIWMLIELNPGLCPRISTFPFLAWAVMAGLCVFMS